MSSPFFSVVVMTYNSGKTILETLDSLLHQQFDDLEIIVTDDCSKDDTVQVCQQWIAAHQQQLRWPAQLLTTPVNTGTSPNANRGCRAAHGQWLKCLGGDDRLLPDGLAKAHHFISSNTDTDIIFSKVIPFGDMATASEWPWLDTGIYFRQLSHREFKIRLSEANFLPAASALISSACFEQLGGYEESIPLLEDWPFWVKAVFRKRKLAFLDDFIAEYRFSPSSISLNTDHEKAALYRENNERVMAFIGETVRRYDRYLWICREAMNRRYQSWKWKKLYKIFRHTSYYKELERFPAHFQQLMEQNKANNAAVLQKCGLRK